MREYTFEEVITNIKEGETYNCTDDSFMVKSVSKDINGIFFNDSNNPTLIRGINVYQRFVKEEIAVTFEEVLKSNKRCKVEHELLHKYELQIDYSILSQVLYNLVNRLSLKDIKE
jgi:hypothetical protein